MRRLGIVLGCVGTALAVLAPGAGAATITVTETSDTPAAVDFDCTLRKAVQSANTNTNVADCTGVGGYSSAPDTIVLESGEEYTLDLNSSTNVPGGDNANVDGDIDIESPLTITTDGPGLAEVDSRDDLSGAGGIDFTATDRVFHIEFGAGAVTLNRLRITGGVTANGSGFGGFLPTQGGGGVLTESPLTVTNSEIVGNIAQQYDINRSQMGGGIMVRGDEARLTMTGSTVADNTVRTSPDFMGGGAVLGGGIAAYGLDNGFPVPLGVSISNSTISGNKAIGTNANQAGFIGGIFSSNSTTAGVPFDSTPTTLTNVTITENTATSPTPANGVVGGIQAAVGTVTGSIIAANTDSDSARNFDDCGLAGMTSGGGNLIGRRGPTTECNFSAPNDLVGGPSFAARANPSLGNLVLNAPGLTRTHAPNPGSPAINRGGTCLATDQLGLFRYIAAPCDAGSVEIGATSVPPPTVQTPVTQPPVTQPPSTNPPPAKPTCPKGKKLKTVKGKRKCVKKKRKKK